MKIFTGLILFLTINLAVFGQKNVVPILEFKVAGLLGGVQNGKFVDAKTAAKSIKSEEKYTLYGLLGAEEGEFTAAVENPEAPCEDFYFAKSEPEIKSGIAIGSGINWNPAVRTAQKLGLTSKTYVKIISDFIKTQKISKPQVQITQAFRIDLDGDGRDEVILSATRYSGQDITDARAGDYSFVLLRKIAGKSAQNILLAGEFYPKSLDFNAPSKYEVSSIADLNGDGKLEVVVYSEYYEGSSTAVFEINGQKPKVVLDAGCGV